MAGGQKYTVVLVTEARDGLSEIVRYLKENVSGNTAKKVLDAVLNGISTLSDRPKSHGYVNILNDDGNIMYRRVLVLKGKYVIIYTIDEAEARVNIVDISRSSRGSAYWDSIKGRT